MEDKVILLERRYAALATALEELAANPEYVTGAAFQVLQPDGTIKEIPPLSVRGVFQALERYAKDVEPRIKVWERHNAYQSTLLDIASVMCQTGIRGCGCATCLAREVLGQWKDY